MDRKDMDLSRTLVIANPCILQGSILLEWEDFCFGIFTLDITVERGPTRDGLWLDRWIRLISDREDFISTRISQPPPCQRGHVTTHFQQYRFLMSELTSITRTMRLSYVWTWLRMLCIFLVTCGFKLLRWKTGSAIFAGVTAALLVILIPDVMCDGMPGLGFTVQVEPSPDNIPGAVYAVLTRKATFCRDYNYGVRSLLEELLQKSLPPFESDLSEEELYYDLTIQMLRATRCGHVLVAASLDCAPNCSSWVPTWSKEWTKPLNVFDEHLPVGDATAGSLIDFNIGKHKPHTLCIRGTEIAEITAVYPPYSTIDFVSKVALADRLVTKILLRRGAIEYYQGDRCWDICNILLGLADKLFDMVNSSRNFDKIFPMSESGVQWSHSRMVTEKQRLQKHLMLLQQDPEARNVAPPQSPTLDGFAQEENPALDGEWVFFDAVKSGQLNRTTRALWDMGLAKGDVRVGDRIVLLSGVPAPLVLRPRAEGGYAIISPGRRLDRPLGGRCWDRTTQHEYPYLEIY